MKTTMKQVYDAFTRSYRDLLVVPGKNYYVTVIGEPVFRIETKGRTGKTMYRNLYYMSDGHEIRVHGMDGATGKGWGGMICGYMTRSEIDAYDTIR